MAAAPFVETSRRKVPHSLSATLLDQHYDALITAAVLAVVLFPPLLILMGLSWLALTDPSTLWMLVTLYFQTIPG